MNNFPFIMMKLKSPAINFALLVIIGISASSLTQVSSLTLKPGPGTVIISNHSGSEYLDSEQKYLLAWNIINEEEKIYFEVTAETTGFVGFGISPTGGMTGADIFVAGVYSNGSSYSSDLHGVGNQRPIQDLQSDWNLTFSEETEFYTKLRFHRALNTCDEDDLEITDGTMRLIWALGQTDELNYHGSNRGTKSVNFYLQNEDEFESSTYEKLDLVITTEMPSEHTAYWCTIHRAPVFNQKQHIVAFEAVLENALALRHTHHFILRRCFAPPGLDPEELFEPWVGHVGDYCYGPKNSSFPFLPYCSQYAIYVWSKGGKRLVFPENLGLPMPETLGVQEYYSLDIHYDNPSEVANVEFKTGARMYYTSYLREMEVGMLRINQEVQPQLTIPPQSKDFVVVGHCSGDCTQKFLPHDGVTIFNNLLHAHLAGRKMRLRHFRGEEELPWLDNDEYYDFDFQQNKPLTNYRKVARGDQLSVECTYDTMNVDEDRAVIGGLGTREEMCEAIVYFYPRVEFSFCGSYQDLHEHFDLLGVDSWDIKESSIAGELEYEILEPENLAGDYRESVSFKVNWTNAFRERFQREKRFGQQVGFCTGGSENSMGLVTYPENLSVYVPPNECEGVTTGPTTPRSTTPEDCDDEDCLEFEEWMKHSIRLIKEKLKQLQDSVDRLTGNQTLENGQK